MNSHKWNFVVDILLHIYSTMVGVSVKHLNLNILCYCACIFPSFPLLFFLAFV